MHVCCILPSPCARPFDLYREMPEFAEFFMEEPIEALLLLTKAIMQVRDVTTATYTVCMCGHVSTAIRTHTQRAGPVSDQLLTHSAGRRRFAVHSEA